jgi:hypothetical protein
VVEKPGVRKKPVCLTEYYREVIIRRTALDVDAGFSTRVSDEFL